MNALPIGLVLVLFTAKVSENTPRFEITVETNYSADGAPAAVLVETSLTLNDTRYLRLSFGNRTLIARNDIASGDARIALDQGNVVLYAKHVWPKPKALSPKFGDRSDERNLRKFSGMKCFPERRKLGNRLSVAWRSVSDPSDIVAGFSFTDGRIEKSLIRIERRIGRASDIEQFRFPEHAKEKLASKEAFNRLNFQFILPPVE